MGLGALVEWWKLRAGGRPAYDDLCYRAPFRFDEGPRKAADVRHRAGAQRAVIALLGAAILLLGSVPQLRADKLSVDERLEIERGLTAEFATARVQLPRSKKPLVFHSNGQFDRDAWDDDARANGAAARLGDEIQITRVVIDQKKILLQINGGTKSGHWYDHVQVGMNGGMSPIDRNQSPGAANGTNIALVFPQSVPALKASDIRQMLSPIFDFEKHSAAEQYVAKLPAPIKKAIEQQKAINGMDRDQVLLALGKPQNKSRETTADGDNVEEWVYGQPPGKVTFVKFDEGKVVEVEESYANVGGSTAPPLPPVR